MVTWVGIVYDHTVFYKRKLDPGNIQGELGPTAKTHAQVRCLRGRTNVVTRVGIVYDHTVHHCLSCFQTIVFFCLYKY